MTANKILFDAHQSLAANMLLFGVHDHQESDHTRTRDSMTLFGAHEGLVAYMIQFDAHQGPLKLQINRHVCVYLHEGYGKSCMY